MFYVYAVSYMTINNANYYYCLISCIFVSDRASEFDNEKTYKYRKYKYRRIF